jgi:hypothetical protein
MIFDHSGKVVGQHQLEHRQILPQAGWVEHDATEIWLRTQEVITGALKQAGILGSQLTGIGITIEEGELDPGPDVALTGQEVNISLNSVSIDVSVDAIPDGIQLNTSLGNLGFASTGSVTLTGNALTLSLNSVNIQIWTEVDTGTPVNYTEVNTGTDATWIEVDTAA